MGSGGKMLLNNKLFNTTKFLLGMFLLIFFGQLFPYRIEIFSGEGIFAGYNYPLNLSGYFNSFFLFILWIAIFVSSLMLIFSKKINIAAFSLFIMWIVTISKIPFFLFPPHLGYIGFTLLTLSFVERKEARFVLPNRIYNSFWIILGLSYFTSATAKYLSSSEWATGELLKYLLESPVTYDYFLTNWIKGLNSEVLNYFSKLILFLEFLILPLSLLKNKKITALAITCLHLGILITCRIPDISLVLILTAWILIGDKNEKS